MNDTLTSADLDALGIVHADALCLRERAIEVDPVNDDVIALKKRLCSVMRQLCRLYRFTRGFGLAAPQIGIGKRAFVFGFVEEQIQFAMNPKVLEASAQTQIGYEGCLSFWEWRGLVSRPERVTIRYCDEFGKVSIVTEYSDRARLLMHEVDHLDGVLYRDRMQSGCELMPLGEYMARGLSSSAMKQRR